MTHYERCQTVLRRRSVEWPETDVQRSFDPSILEGQVTAAADIQACQVTDSKQP